MKAAGSTEALAFGYLTMPRHNLGDRTHSCRNYSHKYTISETYEGNILAEESKIFALAEILRYGKYFVIHSLGPIVCNTV